MAEIKSSAQIVMDFNKARNQAGKLDEAARSIRRESKRFMQCRADVVSAWTGDNATKFASKMGLVSEDLDKIASSLERAADTIRKNAKTIYDADMEARRIAEIRTFK